MNSMQLVLLNETNQYILVSDNELADLKSIIFSKKKSSRCEENILLFNEKQEIIGDFPASYVDMIRNFKELALIYVNKNIVYELGFVELFF